MSVTIPLMNPIRFYRPADTPNFSSKFPVFDNVTQRTQTQQGLYPASWYKDYIVNKEIQLQFRVSGLSDENITVTEPNGDIQLLTPTDISPGGWTGDTVNRYNFTPDQEGVHYMEFNEEGQLSDKFMVHSVLKFRKRLVEVVFYNLTNDYGMIFWDGITQKYTGTTYFTGILKPTPKNEISAFETDQGSLTKLQATPVRAYTLTLTDIHNTYYDNIDHIFSCDFLQVNGVEFQTAEAPEISEKEKSDLIDVTVVLSMVDNDFMAKDL